MVAVRISPPAPQESSVQHSEQQRHAVQASASALSQRECDVRAFPPVAQ